MKKLLTTLGLLVALSSHAMEPLKIVVGYKPGSATDLTARIYSKALEESGMPNVVINYPGAESIIAAKKMVDDPNAILVAPAAVIYSELTMKGEFDFSQDLYPLTVLELTEFLGFTRDNDTMKSLLSRDINVCAGNTQTLIRTQQIAQFYKAKWNIVMTQSNAEALLMVKRGDAAVCFSNFGKSDTTAGVNIISRDGAGLGEFFKTTKKSPLSWRAAFVSHKMPNERREEIMATLKKVIAFEEVSVHPMVRKTNHAWLMRQIEDDKANVRK